MNESKENETSIPFTARLMAYYRAQESKKDNPLFKDPFAEKLAGDLTSYFENDQSFAVNDYPLIRSYYIDKYLLTPWCKKHDKSQIAILGSGFDTRAYRFSPLKSGNHFIYEIDFQEIHHYKEDILTNEKALCQLKRIPTDLSNTNWISHLINEGFSSKVPTFWILEGLTYYIEREIIISLINNIAKISINKSEIFADTCDPVCAEVDFGPYFRHFKWGLIKEEVVPFFNQLGWEVSCINADDYDQGRFVGNGLMMFNYGKKKE